MSNSNISNGFASASEDGARAFRTIMIAMARPGKILELNFLTPPEPLSPAAGAVLLTLCDPDTSVKLFNSVSNKEVKDWLAFQTGALTTEAHLANFVIGSWPELNPLNQFKKGNSKYPDRSATLIVECDDLKNSGMALRGPGIETVSYLSLPETEAFQINNAQFPLGVDFIFCAGSKIAALPRSTKVTKD
jgi:alpha-D-ribose 1-methylphosphonate 5-triphosphate synthase subunit PhnH